MSLALRLAKSIAMSGIKNLPDLAQNLGRIDPGFLKIVAELWGVEFDPSRSIIASLDLSEPRQTSAELAALLLDPQLVAEVLKALPEAAQHALEDLQASGGSMPWAQFIRRHGEVREMGPGRRDREMPHRNPVSAVEMLWYRALVGRAFFDTSDGPVEFAYIPEDLLALLPQQQRRAPGPVGRPAGRGEYAHVYPASDRILDDACTLLAGLRLDLLPEEIELHPHSLPHPLSPLSLKALLDAAGMLDEQNHPLPEPTRAFLEAGRGEALAALAKAWLDSQAFNELSLLADLILEGEWANDPLRARRAILDLLSTVPYGTWWNLESFVAGVREQQPDFQRPAGDYDSWFIRSRKSGEYLRGFECWEQVDGALVRFIITEPLHWLGFLDLAAPGSERPVSAFRWSGWSGALLAGKPPSGLAVEKEKLLAGSDARLQLSTGVPRTVRYQIARFCAWEKMEGNVYRYRLTPASLERARRQGLRVSHLIALLRRHAEAVPPSLVRALERWEEAGVEARFEKLVVLRFASPEVMQKVRASRAARFLGEPLGPTAVIVKPGAQEKVLAILAELGYLGEIKVDL